MLADRREEELDREIRNLENWIDTCQKDRLPELLERWKFVTELLLKIPGLGAGSLAYFNARCLFLEVVGHFLRKHQVALKE